MPRCLFPDDSSPEKTTSGRFSIARTDCRRVLDLLIRLLVSHVVNSTQQTALSSSHRSGRRVRARDLTEPVALALGIIFENLTSLQGPPVQKPYMDFQR